MNNTNGSISVWFRLILCAFILAAGIGGFLILKNMKKPPAQTEVTERPLPVKGRKIALQDFPVSTTGFGEVRSRTVVPLSVEVAGKVTEIHDRLEPGEIIREGEVLVTLDDRDAQLALRTADERLQVLNKELELAQREYSRLQTLYEKNRTGSLSAVEKAEASLNSVRDRISLVNQSREAARLRIERSVLRAPFTCRIAEVMVEKHEYVTPGKKLLTLTDDTDLEISVSLSSRDIVDWLSFKNQEGASGAGWFRPLEGRQCRIVWSEDARVFARGNIDRIIRYDERTRTLQVAVSIIQSPGSPLVLVEGMFCRVTIPGKVLEQVVVLPRQVVSYEKTVYVAENGRLKTRQVSVARMEEEVAVISGGLEVGEVVVTTRLEHPLENTLLAVTLETDAEK